MIGMKNRMMPKVPKPLQEAIDRGKLSTEQLRQLIELEARLLGLSVEEVIQLAKKNDLPRNYVGRDLSLLVELLELQAA